MPRRLRRTVASGTAKGGRVCEHCGAVHPRGRFVRGCAGPRLHTGQHSALVKSGTLTGEEHTVAAMRTALHAELVNVGIVKTELADAFTELAAIRSYLGG